MLQIRLLGQFDIRLDKKRITITSRAAQSLFAYLANTAGLENVAFSPDGKHLLTGSDDGTAMLWDVDYHTTMEYLCSRLLRDFTEEERAQYGITDNVPTCPPRP